LVKVTLICNEYVLYTVYTAYTAEFALSAQILPVLNEKKGGVHVLGGRFVPSLGRQRLTAMG